eukprot:scaffold106971_cov23-Tisochrysis_lutea.AAC.2
MVRSAICSCLLAGPTSAQGVLELRTPFHCTLTTAALCLLAGPASKKAETINLTLGQMSKSLFDRAPIIIMLMFEGASPHISQRRIASYGSTHTHTHTRTHAHAQHTPEHFLFCSVCPQQEEEVLGSRMLEELQPLCAEGCVNVLGDCCGYSPHHVATLRDMAMAHCPRQ